jgi:hypothetical protein
MAIGKGDIFMKGYLQKRIGTGGRRRGNHLGCREGRQGIAVRTQWQSGIGVGDAPMAESKGNCLSGNGRFLPGKANPT